MNERNRGDLLRLIDTKANQKDQLEEKKEKAALTYKQYQDAHDRFRGMMNQHTVFGHEVQLALTALIEQEQAMGQQAGEIASTPERAEMIKVYNETLDEISSAFIRMREQEMFGDVFQKGLRAELRQMAGRIEHLDSLLDRLVRRLFEDGVDLSEVH